MADIWPEGVLLDVGGIGFEVQAPVRTLSALPAPGGKVTLFTCLRAGRDQPPALYGFSTLEERALFRLLLGVPGIGEKMALAIVGIHDRRSLEEAVAQGCEESFVAISGIGRKKAARLLFELGSKLSSLSSPTRTLPGEQAAPDDLKAALASLGYTEKEISWARTRLGPGPLESRVREALGLLSKNQVS